MSADDWTLSTEGQGISKYACRWYRRPVSCYAACTNTELMELLRPDASSNKSNVCVCVCVCVCVHKYNQRSTSNTRRTE